MKRRYFRLLLLGLLSLVSLMKPLKAQIDVDHVISIGRNALYFNDYVVSISYFNRAIDARPWLAMPYLYRSIAKISLDDYQGAIQDASACIERNPYLGRAYLVRGIAYQNIKAFDKAKADYTAGLKLAPDNEGMRYNLVLSHLALKEYPQAEQAAQELMRYSPRNKEVYGLRAGIALEQGDTTLALGRIQEALQRDSLMALPHRLSAGIYAERKAWKQAERSLSRAIELDDKPSPDLFANRAIMHYQLGNLTEAMQDYSSALERDPQHRTSLHNRALLRQFVGELSESISDWDRLISSEPNNYIARYNRALLNIQTGSKLREAEADLNAVLGQYPNFAEGFVQRSVLRRRLGNLKGSEQDYWHARDLQANASYQSKALAQAKRNKQTREASDLSINKHDLLISASKSYTPREARYSSAKRGRVQDGKVQVEPQPPFYLSYFTPLGEEGKPLDGGAGSTRLLERYNAESGSELRLGLQSQALTLSSDQIKTLEAELASLPEGDKPYLHLRRGIALSLLQDYAGAIRAFERCLELEPSWALTRLALALVVERSKELNREHSSEQNAESLQGQILSGAKVLGQGQSSTLAGLPSRPLKLDGMAKMQLDKLLELDPTIAHAYYNRAYILEQAGDHTAALRDYNRAIELAPRLGEAYYNRGLIYSAMGKQAEAIMNLSKAGQLGIYQAYSLIKQLNL